MRYLSYALLLILSFIFQSTFCEAIAILDIKPNLILITIISISLLRGELEGAAAGFFGGLLLDLYSPFIGLNAFICMITGYITGVFTVGLYKENPFVPVTTVFAVTFIYEFLFYIFSILLKGYTSFGYFFKIIFLREMVYNALFALAVYGIVYFVNKRLEAKEHFKRKLF